MRADEGHAREKRKREVHDVAGGWGGHDEDRTIMDVMCEEPDAMPDQNADRDIAESSYAELEECSPKVERPSCVDLSLDQEPDHEAIYDDLISTMLEHDEVGKARLDEMEALRKMDEPSG